MAVRAQQDALSNHFAPYLSRAPIVTERIPNTNDLRARLAVVEVENLWWISVMAVRATTPKPFHELKLKFPPSLGVAVTATEPVPIVSLGTFGDCAGSRPLTDGQKHWAALCLSQVVRVAQAVANGGVFTSLYCTGRWQLSRVSTTRHRFASRAGFPPPLVMHHAPTTDTQDSITASNMAGGR